MESKRLLTLMMAAIVALTVAKAAYVVHSLKGNVIVVSARPHGKNPKMRARQGISLLPQDKVIIPEGGSLVIRNTSNNVTYKSLNSGEMEVSQLMHNAKALATNNSANVINTMDFGKGRSAADKTKRVYSKEGVVTRSMQAFDTTANMEVSPAALALLLADFIDCRNEETDTTLCFSSVPTALERAAASNPKKHKKKPVKFEEYGFKVKNTLSTPIYLNVIKVSGLETRDVEISPLGQPVKSYVLLPGQVIVRTQEEPIDEEEMTLLVATHYNFDVDNMIMALKQYLNNNIALKESPDPSLRAFIRRL